MMSLVEKKNSTIKNTYHFTLLLESCWCNPNGDPDMGNLPRQDMETGIGVITDVAIKRRIRDYIATAYAEEPGMDILMKNGTSMNKKIAEVVFEANGFDKDHKLGDKFTNKKIGESAAIFAKKYWDARSFGAVLSTGKNAGQIMGPVQFAMAESVDPIHIEDMTITRMCYTLTKENFKTLKEYEDEEAQHEEDKKRTMGEKKVTPYALYVVRGSISPNLASKTGFTEYDLDRLFEAIIQMYDFNNTSSKQGMRIVSPLFIFKHVGTNPNQPEQNAKEAMLGCMPAHKLYNMLKVEKKEDVEFPRKIEDYNISFNFPKGMKGVQVGIKTLPFEDIIWQNEKENEFIETLKEDCIVVNK